MSARFIYHPNFGIEDYGTLASMSAAERINDTLSIGLPDDELTAPISAWDHCSVAEFGAPLAGELIRLGAMLAARS